MRSLEVARTELNCPLCGMPKDVCQARGNENRFSVDYVRCFAMKALHAEQRKLASDGKSTAAIEDPESLAFSVSING